MFEMVYRRKSGRAVGEVFFLGPSAPSNPANTAFTSSGSSAAASSTLRGTEKIMLLDDHPLFAAGGEEGGGVEGVRAEDLGATFDLGLTEKQRRAREGVVLPYFDAQRKGRGEGGDEEGEGGRILYEMGREDDFDEEEDEI